MSSVSAGETSPPTREGVIIPSSSMNYNYLEQEKQQSSTISMSSSSILPPLSAPTSCYHATMSNSSSQIDLRAETPSMDITTPSSALTMCGSVISNAYVTPGVLDLSGNGLEKLNRAASDYVLNTTTLLLDNNCLQRLDNIHTYQCLEKVTLISKFVFMIAFKSENFPMNSLFSLILAFSAKQPTGSDATSS